jgi:addiction module HigA family antidote
MISEERGRLMVTSSRRTTGQCRTAGSYAAEHSRTQNAVVVVRASSCVGIDSRNPLGVSRVEAAGRMHVPFQRLNAIVKGRRGVSADTALLLESLTGWDAQIWLTLRARWDLWHAMRTRGHRPKVRPLTVTTYPSVR